MAGRWQQQRAKRGKALMKHVREVQMWRQVRGLARAVMCETRDLGIKGPRWHTLTFEGDRKFDMRYVCTKDVKKMLLQRARTVYWKKSAAKHEYEKLKEGTWLERALAFLRKKTKEDWTEKHRNVARQLISEGGLVQKKLYDSGWSDESDCQACHKEEGTEKHSLYHCPERHECRREIPEAFSKWKQETETSKKERKWQRGIVTHPLSESQWNRGHFSMKKWESEKHKSWACQQKASKATLQLTPLFWVPLESGELVAGQWRSWIMMKNWCLCMGCGATWRQNSGCSEPSSGLS